MAPTEKEKYSVVNEGIEPPFNLIDINSTTVNIVV